MKIKLFLICFICICVIFQTAAGNVLTVSYLERPPYYKTVDGYATGILIDLTRQILEDAGVKAVYLPLPPKRIFREIQNPGSMHCSVGWFKSTEREEFAKFSLPIYQNKPLVALTLKKNGEKFKKFGLLEDLFADKSLTLGTVSAFSYGIRVDEMIKKDPPVIFEVKEKQAQLIKMIAAGRISYMLISPEEIEMMIQSADLNPNDFISLPFSDIPKGNKRYLMFSKSVPDEIIDSINHSIKKLIQHF